MRRGRLARPETDLEERCALWKAGPHPSALRGQEGCLHGLRGRGETDLRAETRELQRRAATLRETQLFLEVNPSFL